MRTSQTYVIPQFIANIRGPTDFVLTDKAPYAMSIAPSFVVDAVEMPPIVLEGTVFAIAAGKVEARPHRDFMGLLQVFPSV